MTPWDGGDFGARGRCLLAPNPGLMTLDGTNTWVLREPGASRSVVVDPGPVEEGHLDVVDEIAGDVALILLTHHHYDHSEVAAELARRKRCAHSGRIPASFTTFTARVISARSSAASASGLPIIGSKPLACIRFAVLGSARTV